MIYEHGLWHDERVRNLRMLEQDVITADCPRGLMRMEQVRHATMERHGKISIVAKPD